MIVSEAEPGTQGAEKEGSSTKYGDGGQVHHPADGATLVAWHWAEGGLDSSSSAGSNSSFPVCCLLTPDLEAEASLPEKKGNTLSRDLIDYVRHMVANHGEDYKVSGEWRRPAESSTWAGGKTRRPFVIGSACVGPFPAWR